MILIVLFRIQADVWILLDVWQTIISSTYREPLVPRGKLSKIELIVSFNCMAPNSSPLGILVSILSQ